MRLYKMKLPALWLLLVALCSISSTSIETQIRRSIPVDVDDVMTREYTETAFTSEIICAAATSVSHLYCYNAPRCLTGLSSYGDIRGPMTRAGPAKLVSRRPNCNRYRTQTVVGRTYNTDCCGTDIQHRL